MCNIFKLSVLDIELQCSEQSEFGYAEKAQHLNYKSSNIQVNRDAIQRKDSTSDVDETCPLLRQLDSLQKLKHINWYWGPLTWVQAENLLKGHCDGTFLVRDSSHSMYFLTISVVVNNHVRHSRIEHSTGLFSFQHQTREMRQYSSHLRHYSTDIIEFIERNVAYSRSRRCLFFLKGSDGRTNEPIDLLNPLSRSQNVFSLRHICRFKIRCYMRIDRIEKLDIPEHLKDYCRQPQIFAELDT
ncbi:hypothetical protein GJ496_008244 [Pomphorhynchus laevis]|nr:hypothetical protein GJ496_008244 [Pomphorhynchus laevis]